MIGILLISTGKYKRFVKPLINQIDELFLSEYHKTIFVFTDEIQVGLQSKNKIIQFLIPAYKFPYPTLLRYQLFDDKKEELANCTHLYYMDVDMAIVDNVGDEILVDGLMVVRHPGYYVSDGWGNGENENPKESTSYMPTENRTHYYCGGVQGGNATDYLELSKVLADNIKTDEENGVMAIWHDETHYNKFISENKDIQKTEFTPTYCMVEQQNLRVKWGIDDLPVKIIALEKEHSKIRE